MADGKEKVKARGKGKEKKNDAGEKLAGSGKNDDDDGGIATKMLKLDLHCEGCARKVRRSVRHFEGVENVKADYRTGKLTVKGNVDPLWLQETVERKTKKKVTLLSAQPKIDGAGAGTGEKKSDEKVEKKAEEKNKSEDKKPKKAQHNAEVVGMHCDGGAQKVKRFIIKNLTPYLRYKWKRNVKAVPPKKKGNGSGVGGDGDGGNEKKKEVAHGGGGGGSGKKKEGESMVASRSTEPNEKKAEVMNKMEYYYGYSNPNAYYAMPPMYNQNYSNQDYGVTMQDHGYYGHTSNVPPPLPPPPPPPYFTTPRDHGYYGNTGYVSPRHSATSSGHGYGYNGYVPPPYTAPQYFSDENPSACSVM